MILNMETGLNGSLLHVKTLQKKEEGRDENGRRKNKGRKKKVIENEIGCCLKETRIIC